MNTLQQTHKAVFIVLTFILLHLSILANTGQYTLTYRDDPATTMVIGWSGDEGTVYYGTNDEGTLTPIRLITEWTESEVLMGTTENLLD
jgi:hypothetical protein